MNFFGHTYIAGFDRSAEFLLGTMVPDFATMIGNRLTDPGDGAVAEGIRHHHRTDDVFHCDRHFVELTTLGEETSLEYGMGSGPSRALAHVGVELLLDGWIARTHGIPPIYRQALRTPAPPLRWHRPNGDEHLAQLQRRLVTSGIPTSYQDHAFVAARLIRILAGYPTLAIQPDHRWAVEPWLDAVAPHVAERAPALLSSVQDGVTTTT